MPAADWLRATETEPQRECDIHVLACNWDAYRTYALCQPTAVGGGMAIVWLGVAASEIRSACALLRIARAEWPDLAERVRYIGDRVAASLNQKAMRHAAKG